MENSENSKYVPLVRKSELEKGEPTMIVTYSAVITGEVEIDDDELAGKTADEREIIINTYVAEAAAEDLDSNLEWEIDE